MSTHKKAVHPNFARLSMALLVAIQAHCDQQTVDKIIDELPSDLKPDIREMVRMRRLASTMTQDTAGRVG